MATNRRALLKGMFAGAATVGLGGTSLGWIEKAQAATAPEQRWDRQKFANIRETTSAEFATLTGITRTLAAKEGYPDSVLGKATAKATMAVSPRGTNVGKCALILDDSSVFVGTKEFGNGRLDRTASQVLWTDGQTTLRELVPSLHAQSMTDNANQGPLLAAAANSCCDPTGQASGTCCEYNFKGFFECCAPCGFSLPAIPAFIACALIWCNYCNSAYCTRWYSPGNC